MTPKIAFAVSVMVAMLVAMVAADGKKEDKYAKNHPHRYHKEFLGSVGLEEDFDELPEEEASERLLILAEKMDRNSDHQVDRDELHHWIKQSLHLLDKEQAYKEFHEVDENGDKKIEWKEILDHYNITAAALQALRHKRGRNGEEEKQLQEVLEDETKFRLADLNKDNALDFDEYAAFHNPEMEDYKHMHPFLVEDDMKDYDKNKDNKLDLNEFHYFEQVGFDDEKDDKAIKERTPEEKQEDKEKFELYDLNKDGFLDKAELRPLAIHDYSEDADEDVEYLFSKADDNKDGILSMNEIKEHTDVFVGHTATGGEEPKYLHFVKQSARDEDEL